LSGCGFDEAPDARLKDRADYCYEFKVDPWGQGNHSIGFADEIEYGFADVVGGELFPTQYMSAADVRVAGKYYDNEEDDTYEAFVYWTADDGGYITVEGCEPW